MQLSSASGPVPVVDNDETTVPGTTVPGPSVTTPVGTKTVYFTNNKGWSDVKAYAWNAQDAALLGEWPGKLALYSMATADSQMTNRPLTSLLLTTQATIRHSRTAKASGKLVHGRLWLRLQLRQQQLKSHQFRQQQLKRQQFRKQQFRRQQHPVQSSSQQMFLQKQST